MIRFVWNEYEREGAVEEWDAEVPEFGVYYNIRLEYDGYHLSFWDGTLSGPHDTSDEAKDAAESDLHRRLTVLNALASTHPATSARREPKTDV